MPIENKVSPPTHSWKRGKEERVFTPPIRLRPQVEEYSCVVRVLESIVGIPAPEKVYEARYEQINALPTHGKMIAASLEPGAPSLEELYTQAVASDFESIPRLILEASSEDTPFGQRLANFEPILTTVDRSSLFKFIDEGTPFMAFIQITGNADFRLHAIHLGSEPENGKLISLTDPDLILNPDDQCYRGVIFQPRRKAQASLA